MHTTNGQIFFTLQPSNTSASSFQSGTFFEDQSQLVKSCNDTVRYQITWSTPNLTEAIEPSAANGTISTGDVVYIKFVVEACTDLDNAAINGWDTIAEVSKTRDIISRKYDTGAPSFNHRFTIDISQAVSSELNYSLCPIGKGTWQSNYSEDRDWETA